MARGLDRRGFLRSAAVGAAAAMLPRLGRAQAHGAVLTARPLVERITLIEGAGTNIVAFAGSGGALLVDGGLPPHSAAVLEMLPARPESPRVAALFNSNWRAEHTGLNAHVNANGGRTIAHVNTWLWMRNDFEVRWENLVHEPQPENELPAHTFYKEESLEQDGETVRYGHLPQAHTDGDLYVLFENANVLVASDLLAVDTYPVVDYVTGGWIGGLERATQALLDMSDADTLIVPAAGAVQRRPVLERQLEFCGAIKDTVGGMIKNGRSVEEVLAAAPTKGFDEGWTGDPELFLRLAYQGLYGHIRELGGVL